MTGDFARRLKPRLKAFVAFESETQRSAWARAEDILQLLEQRMRVC
jgi:hypothetical protein